METDTKAKPSLLRKVTSFGAGIGFIIADIGLILGSFVKLNSHISGFLSIIIITTFGCGITALYLIIKEEKYWTNDPKVMSPLRKLGKMLVMISSVLMVLAIIIEIEMLFIISAFVAIFALIVWKIKFVPARFNYYNSTSSNIYTDPSYSSVSGNIYNS